MIKKLRRKFILILMSVVTVILLAVFAALLVTTIGNSRRMGEEMLSQALNVTAMPNGFPAPERKGGWSPENGASPSSRMPVLLVEVGANGEALVLTNQLFFISDDEVSSFISSAINVPDSAGVLQEHSLRWMKSEDGSRIAFTDISSEQEMLRSLVLNALPVGAAALLAFFFISVFLSRWAVRPVEQAWERQRQFIADASHELKTPLTVILSNADMLSRDGTFTDEKKARRMEHIQSEAGRMKRLVEALLTLAGSDSASPPQLLEKLDFSDLATNAALAMEPVMYDEKRRFEYRIEEKLAVMGDSDKLGQLLQILLDNAVKYSPVNSLIQLRLKGAEHGMAVLTVTSEGEPLSKEERKQIFERFYRTDSSRLHLGGFGLGLSIANNIVREHRGKIWAESSKDPGNTFVVSLPRA